MKKIVFLLVILVIALGAYNALWIQAFASVSLEKKQITSDLNQVIREKDIEIEGLNNLNDTLKEINARQLELITTLTEPIPSQDWL